MSDRPLLEGDLAWVEGSLRAWCEVQRRAGALDTDIVGVWRVAERDGPPAATVALHDVAGLVTAYVEALPPVGGESILPSEDEWLAGVSERARPERLRKLNEASNAPREAWEQRAGALLAIVGDGGERWTAFLALDGEICSTPDGYSVIKPDVHEDSIRILDGRVQIRGTGDDGCGRWIGALDPAGSGDKGDVIADDVANLAGLSTLVAAAGGHCWFADTPSVFSDGRRSVTRAYTFNAFRMGALSTPIAECTPKADALAALAAGGGAAHHFGLVRLAHLRKLVELVGEATLASVVEALTMRPGPMFEGARRLRACNGSWPLLMKLPGMAAPEREMKFVVPGFLPRGSITLVAGVAQTGKSTLLHHLAIMVATPPAGRDTTLTWLGVPAGDIAEGRAVFLSGEDDEGIIATRHRRLAEGADSDVMEFSYDGASLTNALANLECLSDVALLVVDPARVFIRGSEDDSANVDEFMSALGAFAARTGCAVVVVHHLRRGSKPSTPAAVLDSIRGSQVFIDRSRSIIGLVRRQGLLGAAVVKTNVPVSCPMRRKPEWFHLDAETFRALPIDGEAGADKTIPAKRTVIEADMPDDVSQVVNAVRAEIEAGRKVTRTGKHGVYERRMAGDMSRRAVHSAIGAALRSGALILRDNGTLAVPEGTLPPLPSAAMALPATETAITDL